MSFARYPSLAGRVAFVTGGGSGIGAAIVRALAEQGARVAFVDILEEASHALIQQLSKVDHKPLFIRCDLTDIGAVRQAIQQVYQELGPVGILVNNAASDERHEVDKVTPDYWDNAMDVNLRHQFFAAQAVRPHMQELGSGTIINFSSIVWIFGGAAFVAYATAKAGVVGLTNSLAREFGADDIRVNAIAPGYYLTDIAADYLESDGGKALVKRIPAQRLGEPREMDAAILMLCSSASSYMTGSTVTIDGGLSLSIV